MVGGAARAERNIHIVGTLGEIKGTFEDSKYLVRQMTPNVRPGYVDTWYDVNVRDDMTGAKSGHGGGDSRLVADFLRTICGEEPSISATDINDSTTSHRVVFKAMEAMRKGTVERV